MHTPLVEEGTGGVAVMTKGQVIRWWELRRLLYNAVLLVVGVAAVAGMEWLMTKVIPLGEDAIEPMILVLGVLVYGFMANLCYTLGWIIELRSRKSNPSIRKATCTVDVPSGAAVLLRADEPAVLVRLPVLAHASRACSLILLAAVPEAAGRLFGGGLAASGASIGSCGDREKKHGALHRL